MKTLLPVLCCLALLFNSCGRCNHLELIPSIVSYLEILDESTGEDLVLGDNPTLQRTDIQITHVTGERQQSREVYLDLPKRSRDSTMALGFLFEEFIHSSNFTFPDTTFIGYSGVYPQDTLLIEYWHADNDCEGSDDLPDNFSLKLNGQTICDMCYQETVTIFK